jgi:hypothetical protein|tara:strand:+ start:354 stop:704 length:351 start_codon:yes stop_codon:yes gene_type:complete
MSCAGSLTILNKTGVTLTASRVTKLNDDANFSGVSNGTTIEDGNQITINMSNNSVFFAPRGVGVEVTLSYEGSKHVTLHLDVPAVGAHTLNSRDALDITVSEASNPGNNAYTQVLT